MEKFAIHLTVLKTYLVSNIDDFFILDQAKKITDLKLEAAKEVSLAVCFCIGNVEQLF
ncbi:MULTISPECIES: hypothetical protein [unclassified Cellulophaga]|uniref:hypothetical protein n=1 Tax=unclassified Cellulophaga TaxID=2634405 RepID=UPI001C4F6589|nr:hypothetical protein [Cellulophaga sp. HaHa_2_1]QXP51238.1 hypothetical protein H0I24_13930 [Cellulophaga sp. HaHa_2_1]